MFATMKLAAVFAAAVATLASAAPSVFNPSDIHEDVVYSPMVTAPTAGAIWAVGSTQNITWDATAIPAELANSTGLILLGYVESDSVNEHLDVSAYLFFARRRV